jgi:YhcH/YjgK/YiaL family protein
MILDQLSHWHQYAAISPRFQTAFGFLEKFDGSAALGRYELDSDNVYALVQKYTTKSLENRQYEAHRRYIDIQFVYSGKETILWAPLPTLGKAAKPYEDKTDAAMYNLIPSGFPVHISPGEYTILFPGDGHVPQCIWDSAAEVSKVVVKVRV